MAPPTSPTPNPTRIKSESATRAVDALLAWTRTRSDHQKAQLFEPDDLLYLLLTLHRIPPSGRTNPYRIPLPHTLHPFDPQSTSICLLADDAQSESVQTRIRDESLPISTVIGLSDLRSDYRPYESRRKLADSYDLFFADRKVLPLLPRLLGNHFFKKKKIPLAVDLSRPGWPQQVRAACESTLLYLRTGTCCALKVGRVAMGSEEIVRNVTAAVEGAVALVPRKWRNVRSMHLKFADSPALPIYEAVPEIGLKIEGVGKTEDVGEVLDAEEEGVKVGSSERKGRKKKGRIHDAEVFYGEDEQAERKDGVMAEEEGAKKRKKESKVVVDGGEKRGDDEAERKDGVMAEEGAKKRKKESKVVVDGGEKRGDDEVDDGGDLSVRKKTRKKKKDDHDNANADDSANQVNKKKEKTSKAMVEEEGERSVKESKHLSGKKMKKDSNVNANAVDSADRVDKKKEKKKSKAVVQDGERSGNEGEDLSAMKRMPKKKKKDADDSSPKLNTKESKAVKLEKSKRSKIET